MLTSLIIGSITKIASDFFETRKSKIENKIEQEKSDKELQRKLELMSAQKEYDLKIEHEKTTQMEFNVIQEEIKKNKEHIKEIHKTDRMLYKKVSTWILDWVAIMKPLIGCIAVVLYAFLIIMRALNKIDYDTLTQLKELQFIGTLEGIIGFWFGFGSMGYINNTKK